MGKEERGYITQLGGRGDFELSKAGRERKLEKIILSNLIYFEDKKNKEIFNLIIVKNGKDMEIRRLEKDLSTDDYGDFKADKESCISVLNGILVDIVLYGKDKDFKESMLRVDSKKLEKKYEKENIKEKKK